MGLEFWRDASIVLLAVEALVLVVVVGIVLYFLDRGTTTLLRQIPVYFTQIGGYLAQAHSAVTRAADAIVAPFISIKVFVARVRGLVAGIRKLFVLR